MATVQSKHSHPAACITRAAAASLVEVALGEASKLGIKVAIAVTDNAGNLKTFEREDGAPLLTAEVAIDKAWSAVSYGIPTHVWNAYITGNANIAPLAHRPRLVAVGGGYPVKEGGEVIGGIGVSGGTYQQDQDIAEAALAALGFNPAS